MPGQIKGKTFWPILIPPGLAWEPCVFLGSLLQPFRSSLSLFPGHNLDNSNLLNIITERKKKSREAKSRRFIPELMDTCGRKELYKQVRAVIKVFLHISVHIGTHQAPALPLALNRKAQERQLPEAPDCHALSLVLRARPLCKTPVSKTKPRGPRTCLEPLHLSSG